MTVSYSFRSSVLDGEKTYSLGKEGITISADGSTTDHIPYQDVQSLNVQFNGSMNNVSRYRCVLRTTKKKVALTNAHYVSLGNFESRDSEYSRFLAELHVRLSPFADQIRFTQGSAAMFISALIFIIVMPPLALLALYLVFVKGESMTFSARSALFAMPIFLALITIPVLRKGRPRPYNGKTVPPAYLPTEA